MGMSMGMGIGRFWRDEGRVLEGKVVVEGGFCMVRLPGAIRHVKIRLWRARSFLQLLGWCGLCFGFPVAWRVW